MQINYYEFNYYIDYKKYVLICKESSIIFKIIFTLSLSRFKTTQINSSIAISSPPNKPQLVDKGKKKE